MNWNLLADKTGMYDSFPQQASTFAAEVDNAYWFIMIIDIVFFIGIVACLGYFGYRYSKRKGEPAESQVSHHTWLEITWSVAPCFLLVLMFFRGALGYLDMRDPPEGAATVNIEAFKWGWTVDYGNGVKHPELHLVVDQPTRFVMRSTGTNPVIHSCFIPAFRMKRDIVPGRYNIAWAQPTIASTKVSDEMLQEALEDKKKRELQTIDTKKYDFTEDGYTFFDLYCTEYCGTGHSVMQTQVVVHETQEDLDAWVKQAGVRPDGVAPAEYGGKLWAMRGCNSCHSVDGQKKNGPTWQNLYGSTHGLKGGGTVTVDENHIRESIYEPGAKIYEGYPNVMPSYAGQLSEDDIYCIVEYMKTISTDGKTTAE
ncbi:MAG: c-type cytochrome [Planctomycetota bacterium]